MWIFRNDAFVSVVADRANPNYLWVRARVKGDIERFFDGVLDADQLQVKTTPEADYLFRAVVDREYVGQAALSSVHAIRYDNFKGSIPQTKEGNRRHDAYMRIWNAMMAYQRQLRPKSGYWWPGKKKG